MILTEAPYAERVDRIEVQDMLEELRYRARAMVEKCDVYDIEDGFGPCADHAELVFNGKDYHAHAIEGSIPELMDRLENALDRLGVPVA